MNEELKKILADKDGAYAKKYDTLKIAPTFGTSISIDGNKAADTLSSNVKFIASTYLWLDGHGDVHAKDVFADDLQDRKHPVFHLADHDFKLSAKLGDVKSIKEETVTWQSLGVNKEGTTQILLVESDTTKAINKTIASLYKSGDITQHSVSMRYVALGLAINDEDEVEEKALWDEYIDQIGNKATAIDKGYFWVVKKAKLREVSATLAGSNELTGVLSVKSEETDAAIEALKAFKDNIDIAISVRQLLNLKK
jgi:hypothetical protein